MSVREKSILRNRVPLACIAHKSLEIFERCRLRQQNPPWRRLSRTFRPTEAQWEAPKIVPVQPVRFQNERTSEGKIANDDDRTTPVFSPYSGRVTKLFVKAGDHVEQGPPLFAVQASECVRCCWITTAICRSMRM
ncbi:MAG: biotin/lipoyl-binding protein [Verrucomicrobia bacterium]|nr:biotin/lipoyl-binding protein [Verrucomicrobiota bacterium]